MAQYSIDLTEEEKGAFDRVNSLAVLASKVFPEFEAAHQDRSVEKLLNCALTWFHNALDIYKAPSDKPIADRILEDMLLNASVLGFEITMEPDRGPKPHRCRNFEA